MAVFREELQEGQARGQATTGNGGHLGVPGMVGDQRASVSSMGSDLGFEPGPEAHDERGNARGVLHSTRASSGVFPEF